MYRVSSLFSVRLAINVEILLKDSIEDIGVER